MRLKLQDGPQLAKCRGGNHEWDGRVKLVLEHRGLKLHSKETPCVKQVVLAQGRLSVNDSDGY